MRALMLGAVLAGLGGVMLVSASRAWKAGPGADSPELNTAGESGTVVVSGPNPGMAVLEAKREVARAVIRREISLVDAALKFRDLSNFDPDYLDRLRRVYSTTATDEELVARNVIYYVRAQFRQPAVRAAEVERLEAELRYHVERGTLRFSG